MTPDDLCQEIKNAYKNGESYAKIAAKFGMSKPAIGRIVKGEKPKHPTCEKMNLEPSAKILRDRARRKAQREELERLRIPEYNNKECPFCYGRMLMQRAIEIIEKMPIINATFYDDETSDIINRLDDGKSTWKCYCEEIEKL